MITYVHVGFIILAVFLLIFYLSQNPLCDLGLNGSDNTEEHFDTYHNHDMGSHDVYEQHPELFNNSTNITVEDARLKSLYDWSKRDSRGMNVYDVMYEGEAKEHNKAYHRNHEAYHISESGGEPYDMKFSTIEGQTGYNMEDMKDNILWQQAGPFAVHLSQKGLNE